ncbi:MAG: winged helix-turn-helix transcriptional regulator [Candidatus Sabulitectum sp.]|nr:winged helix-turn-helix transcriptional regulator [Candidatus Sabulitectum sp.]
MNKVVPTVGGILLFGKVRNDKRSNFPLVALREAAVNAVVHADYSMTGSPARISIFDDRIEIENPGLLQFGVTIEDLLNGVSVLRNRVIGRVFKELGLIEQWGSGIQRMIADCSEMGLRPPDFTETGRNFRVTIFTNPIGSSLFDRADSHILRLLRANPDGLSTSELATILDVTGRTVRNRMKSLVEKGFVLPVGTGPRDPRRRYVISDPE